MPLPTIGFPASLTEAVSTNQAQTITGEKTFGTTLTIAPDAATSGIRSLLVLTAPASTGRTASTEQTDVFVDISATRTWATGALTTQRFARLAAPTIAFVGASTVTTAVTFDIEGAPVAGTNATITNSYAFRVVSGAVLFGGTLAVTGASTFTGAVGVGAAAPASAALAITSTTQGVLFPRMTSTQRDAIVSPASGLVIYNTTTGKLNVRGAAAWEAITSV
jgi:hypothetical protein